VAVILTDIYYVNPAIYPKNNEQIKISGSVAAGFSPELA
jgi:hypothetical protein